MPAWEDHGGRLDTERCSVPITQLYWDQPDLGRAEFTKEQPLLTRLPYYRTAELAKTWFPSPFFKEWRSESRDRPVRRSKAKSNPG